MKDGKVPMRAVIGGVDTSGEKIYVGRVKKDGTLLPGKIVPSHNCCYVAKDGTEFGSSKYQVPCFIYSTCRKVKVKKVLWHVERSWFATNAVN